MILLSPMPVDFFNSLTDVEYSNLLIEAVFSNSPLLGKKLPPVKYSYLLTFPDHETEILAALCFAQFFYQPF